MRDPRRIGLTLTALEHYWRKYPDLRLAQIVCNLAGRSEPYHFEDDDLIEALDAAMYNDAESAS